MNTFYSDKARGKRGEKLVYDALTARGHKLTDLSEDPQAQKKDIDFFVEHKCGQSTTLEVKSDFRSESTGNLFIEYENRNNVTRKGKGWYYYCEAEYICFAQENNRKAFIVLLDELKQTIKKNAFRTASGTDASGFLFPISKLAELESYCCIEL